MHENISQVDVQIKIIRDKCRGSESCPILRLIGELSLLNEVDPWDLRPRIRAARLTDYHSYIKDDSNQIVMGGRCIENKEGVCGSFDIIFSRIEKKI